MNVSSQWQQIIFPFWIPNNKNMLGLFFVFYLWHFLFFTLLIFWFFSWESVQLKQSHFGETGHSCWMYFATMDQVWRQTLSRKRKIKKRKLTHYWVWDTPDMYMRMCQLYVQLTQYNDLIYHLILSYEIEPDAYHRSNGANFTENSRSTATDWTDKGS